MMRAPRNADMATMVWAQPTYLPLTLSREVPGLLRASDLVVGVVPFQFFSFDMIEGWRASDTAKVG